MSAEGISIILVLGICNFALILFQLATGLRIIKIRLGVHKKTGIALLVVAVIHGVLAILAG
jgi:hypothetical protein